MLPESLTKPSKSRLPKASRFAGLPNPRWLPVVAALLAIWALALVLWWGRLRAPAPTAALPTAQPTPVSQARPVPTVTPSPAPAGTPQAAVVVREGKEWVRQEDWVSLAKAFDAEKAIDYIAELASDRYEGRAAGSPGQKKAAEWLAERFAEFGLQPAGDTGTFFQEFSVPYAELTSMPTFQMVDESGSVLKEYVLRQDYMHWSGGYADGGSAEGPVVWVSEGRHEDYDAVNVVDAIVLCRYKYPFDDVLRQALEHGAKAVLLARPGGYNYAMRRTARSNAILPRGIPTLLIGRQPLEDLLLGSGLSVDELAVEYRSLELSTRARVEVPLQYDAQAKGRNVLGVLPGSDPDGTEQVLILGAHYDHLGADPDGTVWGGANDDASGVAVLLEIARQWQEFGYVPKRTVLFAAWDAEEIGLNGSRYYVEHPQYPITRTVGMLQLDMVGAGLSTLTIDPGGIVADQSFASAAELRISTEGNEEGGSDHAPFVGAGVPATVYIWWDGGSPGVIYHVPEDNAEYIQPERLEQAGQLADLVMLRLSWDHEQLEDRLAELEQAVSTRDVQLYSSLLNPADEALRSEQAEWLRSAGERDPAEFSLQAEQPLLSGDAVTSTVTLRFRWKAGDTAASASFPVRWVRLPGASGPDWYYDGPGWEVSEGQQVRVHHLQKPVLARSLATQADAQYEFLTGEAGLELPAPLDIYLYHAGPDGEGLGSSGQCNLLLGLQTPPAGDELARGWPVGDDLVLCQASDVQKLLAELALVRAGWPAQGASWLAQGLSERASAQDAAAAKEIEREHLPILLDAAKAGTLWREDQMPSRWRLESGQQALWEAQAWAMTQDLLDVGGYAALRSPSTPTDGWRSTLLAPWQEAWDGIEATLQARASAVLARDQAAFLATVDAENPVLLQEETHWFDDLSIHPPDEFSCHSALVSLDGDRAVAELDLRYHLVEQSVGSSALSYRVCFVQRDGRWLYADVDWAEQRSSHFVLKHEDPELTGAELILGEAERAYEQIGQDLEFSATQPMEIKVYSQADLFRFSIYMSMIPARGWNEPGEAIKLNMGAQGLNLPDTGRVIAHELTHIVLFAKGVQHGGLHEGVAQYEAGRFAPDWMVTNLTKYRRQVFELVRSGRQLTLEDLDNWREASPDDLQLFYSVGWDFVSYFRQRFGRQGLLEWLRLQGTGQSFADSLQQATGLSFAEVDAQWRESVLRGHIDPASVRIAQGFDAQRSLSHVTTLAQTEWAGRELGTPGNEAAVRYVAERFAEYGLLPAGDEGNYRQELSASHTALTSMPLLSISSPGTDTLSLAYRTDFREILGGSAGAGTLEQPLLYVRDLNDPALQLAGRVVLAQAGTDPWKDVQAAASHGAGGLLLATESWEKQMAIKEGLIQPLSSSAIPVFELTKDAADRVFVLAGYRANQRSKLAPITPLTVTVSLKVDVETRSQVSLANVLGVLPGSDPQLRDQVLVLGAHLDGVGSLPNGTSYPAANNNASGVAVLLEIAQRWQESGYRPRRTVLFAAWNGSESGLLGSSYYVAHPAFPISATVGLIQLDQVGQGGGYYITESAKETHDALLLAELERAAGQVEGRLTLDKYTEGSDHAPFHQRGVPAVLLTWERAEFANTPRDTIEAMDPQKLHATGRTVALALMNLADGEW